MTTINVPIVNMVEGQRYKLPATFTPSTPNHIPMKFINSLKDRDHTLWKKTVLTTGHIFIEFIPDTEDYNNGIRHLFFHSLFFQPNTINEYFEQLNPGPIGAGASRRGGKRKVKKSRKSHKRKNTRKAHTKRQRK